MAKAKGNTLPVAFDEELARQAAAYRSAEAAAVTGNSISVRGGVMQWRGQPIEGNKMNVFILGAVFENDYFNPPGFDPDDPRSPGCFAFAATQDALAPHADSDEKQGDANGLCAGCWANAFNSSLNKERPKGKACQNRRRLALVPALANMTADGVKGAELATFRLPVLSVGGYGNHVMAVADTFKMPPYGVVTEISVVPDPKSQYRVLFKPVSQVKDRALLGALYARADAAVKALLATTFPKNTEKPAGKGGKPAAKKPAGKGVERGLAGGRRF